MTKRITAFVSALLICFAMTGCGGSDEGSSKSGNNSPTTVPVTTDGADVTEAPETTEVTTTTTAAVAKTTEPTEATKAEEELDRSHFELDPERKSVLDRSSGKPVTALISDLSYIAREGEGVVDVTLTFHVWLVNHENVSFDYYIYDGDENLVTTGKVNTRDGVMTTSTSDIDVKVTLETLPSPDNYTITTTKISKRGTRGGSRDN